MQVSLVEPRLAPRLRPGSMVGLFAPSFPTSSILPNRFNYAIEVLKRSFDVEVCVAPNALLPAHGFVAGSGAERAEILNGFLRDDRVSAIFCSIGGFNSAEILPHIDWDLARRRPRILVGYSDCTALLLGFQAKAGWVTFHGPAVMTQFGEYPEIYDYTLRSLQQAIQGHAPNIRYRDPDFWTNERLEWADGAWLTRPRRQEPGAASQTWKEGNGAGALWGGNLETVNFLAGTDYFIPPQDIVLFWEATEAEAYLPRIRRALTHLNHCGVLDRTRAMLVGRCPDATPTLGATLRDVVLEAVADFKFPVIAEMAIGHTDPLATLPIGVEAVVNAGPDDAAVTITGRSVL